MQTAVRLRRISPARALQTRPAPISTTPPAQLRLKDALHHAPPPLPHRLGWPGVIISGVLPDAPYQPPQTARRWRREAKSGDGVLDDKRCQGSRNLRTATG